jgi:sperm-associated antigen 1
MSSKSEGIPKVPIENLDYKYVERCEDVDELKDIVTVLESGKEGYFPDLVRAAEKKLLDVMGSKERSKYLAMKYGPSDEDKQGALCDLSSWLDSINACDRELSEKGNAGKRNLPPIRGSNENDEDDDDQEVTVKEETKSLSPKMKNFQRDTKAKPFKQYYREWEKYDVDRELNRIQEIQESQDTKTKEEAEIQRRRREHMIRELSKLNMKPDEIERLSETERKVISENERRKGNESFKAGDFEEAVLYYSRSVGFLPSAFAFANRAMARIKLNQFDGAIEDCTKALRLNSNYSKAMSRRAMSRHKKGQYLLAVQDYNEALKMDNTKKQISSLQALMYRSRDKLYEVEGDDASRMLFDAGLSELRKSAIKKSKSSSFTRLSIDESGSSSEEEEEEEEDHVATGNTFLSNGKYENALEEFEKALKISSRRGDAYVGRARSRLALKKDLELIIRDCCVALAVSSSDDIRKSALLIRAKSRLSLDDAKKSVIKDVESDLRKILEIDRDNVEASSMLKCMALEQKKRGNELFKKRDYVESAEAFQTSLNLDPTLTAARTNLAMAYTRLKDWNLVLKTCQGGLKRDESELTSSHRVKLLYRAGAAYLELGNVNESLRVLRLALNIEPSNSSVNALLASITTDVKNGGDVDVEEMKKKDEVKKKKVTTTVQKVKMKITTTGHEEVKKKKKKKKKVTNTVQEVKKMPTTQGKKIKTPKTSYEFRRVWTSLKRRDWSEKYTYIMTLNSKAAKKLFGRSLEPEVLSDVISTINSALSSGQYNDDGNQVIEILKSFASLKGFSMAMLMMDSSMMDSVSSIFSALLKLPSTFSNDEIQLICKKFTS